MKKNILELEPHPDRVLIKTSKKDHEALFFIWVKKDDGTKVQLFTATEADEGFEAKFQQNVSTGRIIAIGKNVEGILPSDLAILDYIVSSDTNNFVGTINGDKMVCLPAKTTYHDKDALPSITMRKAFVKGDVLEVSKILGVVRNDKLIAFDPFIFLVKKESRIMKVGLQGLKWEEDELIVTREVLSAPIESGYKESDNIIIKEHDLFFRKIGGKEISVCFKEDVMGKR